MFTQWIEMCWNECCAFKRSSFRPILIFFPSFLYFLGSSSLRIFVHHLCRCRFFSFIFIFFSRRQNIVACRRCCCFHCECWRFVGMASNAFCQDAKFPLMKSWKSFTSTDRCFCQSRRNEGWNGEKNKMKKKKLAFVRCRVIPWYFRRTSRGTEEATIKLNETADFSDNFIITTISNLTNNHFEVIRFHSQNFTFHLCRSSAMNNKKTQNKHASIHYRKKAYKSLAFSRKKHAKANESNLWFRKHFVATRTKFTGKSSFPAQFKSFRPTNQTQSIVTV